eukprot:TRINITY_DN7182_c0_g1_i1.p1 TRINITY_DN7182_c0_g1~~TRINITY_DN7182_c0_g1_i1.p1  ORF type:complete len:897 (-),score=322.29 TRINITY_DN7182_c0_g1_i1:45-2735(-)
MNYVEKMLDGVHSALNINAATLSGAIDIIVIRSPDGTLKSTPFHVRFGKLHLLNSAEKYVTVYVNDEEVTDLKMKLGSAGEAFFVEETEEAVPPSLVTSPIGSPPATPSKSRRAQLVQSADSLEVSLTSKLEDLIQKKEPMKSNPLSPNGHVSLPVSPVTSPVGTSPSSSRSTSPNRIRPSDDLTQPNSISLGASSSLDAAASTSKPIPIARSNERAFVRSSSESVVVRDAQDGFDLSTTPQGGLKSEDPDSEISWGWGSLPRVRRTYPAKEDVVGYKNRELDIQEDPGVGIPIGKKGMEEKGFEAQSAPENSKWYNLFRIFKGNSKTPMDHPSTFNLEDGEVPTVPTVAFKDGAQEVLHAPKIEVGFPMGDSLGTMGTSLGNVGSQDLDDYFSTLDEIPPSPFHPPPKKRGSQSSQKSSQVPKVQDLSPDFSEDVPKVTPIYAPSLEDQEIPKGSQIQVEEGIQVENDAMILSHEAAQDSLAISNKKIPEVGIPSLASSLTSSLTLSSEFKVEMSKCGHLTGAFEAATKQDIDKIFKESKISYEDICQNPDLITDSNVVFKIQDKYYPWAIAGPLVISMMAFKKPLTQDTVDKLELKFKEKLKTQEKKGWGAWLWRTKSNSVAQAEKIAVQGIPLKRGVRKSLRPTPEQLKALNLKTGPNPVRFSVTSALQGTREVRSTIYVWDHDVKIVISDIDGTITKSDVFGQILPIIGRDWSHSGVAALYNDIKSNGYEIVYLTARPIGQAGITKAYISTLKQGDMRLPPGPVLMSPNRLLTSFNQEVILRRPEEFKIACLKDIKSLFTEGTQPYYAGFGNRATDALSYRSVGIPLGKIYTINYMGEIGIINHTYKKTYPTLSELVNAMFPPFQSQTQMVAEEFNNFNYWKPPLPALEEYA